jgi:hypothetical protein
MTPAALLRVAAPAVAAAVLVPLSIANAQLAGAYGLLLRHCCASRPASATAANKRVLIPCMHDPLWLG